jgi:hypothetical protein
MRAKPLAPRGSPDRRLRVSCNRAVASHPYSHSYSQAVQTPPTSTDMRGRLTRRPWLQPGTCGRLLTRWSDTQSGRPLRRVKSFAADESSDIPSTIS